MITATYGTFYNATGSESPAAIVADYINGGDADWREQMESSGAIDAITADYADAIERALPDNVWLSGDEFIGPHPEDDAYDEDAADLDSYREIIESVDLAEIIQRHDETAAKSAMNDITEAVNARSAAAERLDAAEEAVAEAVRTALKLSVPATKVADHLGVTRARVYQIRDGRR